jgi:hypothetical protein
MFGFGKKEKPAKSSVELKAEAMIGNYTRLLNDRLSAMSAVYGEQTLVAWLDNFESKLYQHATDPKLVELAHASARAVNEW